MTLISLSGPCGSGKSTLIKMLGSKFDCLGVNYRSSKGADLDPTSYESKLAYSRRWFQAVLGEAQKGKTLIVSDRSPFDSVGYLKTMQDKLKTEVLSNFAMLASQGIFHFAILITASSEQLKRRIRSRIENGERNDFLTNKELPLLDKSLKYFADNVSFFDFVVDTSDADPVQSAIEIEALFFKLAHR
ncbi:MAG TPA: hypothetical protein VF421_20225 [Niabella sp.]